MRRRRVAVGVGIAGGVGVGVGMRGTECDVYEINWERRQECLPKRWS